MSIIRNNKSDLIIIGGGIFGAAAAYYFKRDNPECSVTVFERNGMCSGYTSVAAALLSRVRKDRHIIPLSLETYRVIPELECCIDDSIPVHYNGALHLARKERYVAELSNLMRISSEFNIESEFISVTEAKKLVPWLDCKGNERISFFMGEAFTDPYLLGMAFVNSAKCLGVRFERNTRVTEIMHSGRTITGIKSDLGIHHSDITLVTAGVWSIELLQNLGVSLPMAPVRSQYWITEPDNKTFIMSSPSVIAPEARFYARPAGNALLFGIRESGAVYEDPRRLPTDICNYRYSPNYGWDDLIDNYFEISGFFHEFRNHGLKNYVAGFSGYTPDSQFIAGSIPGFKGILVATGCVGAGLSVSGGIGLGIARMAAGKHNPFDFSRFNPDRFGAFDPYSEEHLKRCAASRAMKTSG